MTPKEKAEQLVNKMIIGFTDWTYHIPYNGREEITIFSEAKQRALIAVEEMLDFMFLSENENAFWINYYNKVKNEINKL